MEVDNRIARLICELEYCIGSECFNPNSYNGWTGEEGCEYRYPVYFRRSAEDDTLTKTWRNVGKDYPSVGDDAVYTMKYKFGSNHLFVGLGIQKLLQELEKRYGLDFNQLENSFQDNKK